MMDVLDGNDHYMNIWNADDDTDADGGEGDGDDDMVETVAMSASVAAATFLLFMGAMNRNKISKMCTGQSEASMSKRGLVVNADRYSVEGGDNNIDVQMVSNPIAVVKEQRLTVLG